MLVGPAARFLLSASDSLPSLSAGAASVLVHLFSDGWPVQWTVSAASEPDAPVESSSEDRELEVCENDEIILHRRSAASSRAGFLVGIAVPRVLLRRSQIPLLALLRFSLVDGYRLRRLN